MHFFLLASSSFAAEVALPTTPLWFDVPDTFVVAPAMGWLQDGRGARLMVQEVTKTPDGGPRRELELGPIETRDGAAGSSKEIEVTVGELLYRIVLTYQPAVHQADAMDAVLQSVRLGKEVAPVELPWSLKPGKGFTQPVALPSLFAGFGYSALDVGSYGVCLPVDLKAEEERTYMLRSVSLGLGDPDLTVVFRPFARVFKDWEVLDSSDTTRWTRVSGSLQGLPDGFVGARRVEIEGRAFSLLVYVPSTGESREAKRARKVFDSLSANRTFFDQYFAYQRLQP